MIERPILFSTPMIRAILAGRKTMTRRVVKPQPVFAQIYEYKGKTLYEGENRTWCWKNHVSPDSWNEVDWLTQFAPYQPGDHLWVRETFRRWHEEADGGCCGCEPEYCRHCPPIPKVPFCYAADCDGYIDEETRREYGVKWTPSIFMPRSASRITLLVTAVRVERLQEISKDDVISEGCYGGTEYPANHRSAVNTFRNLWQSLNAKRPGCSWEDNPWCWVVEFEMMKGGADHA